MVMNKLRLVSLNVRGMRGDKRHTVFRWLCENDFNVVLLQETYCTRSFVTKFNKNWSGEVFHSVSDSEHSRGVCIMLRKGLKCKIIDHHNCNEGRFIMVNMEVDGIGLSIANVYAPNNTRERIEYFSNVSDLIHTHALFNNILIGGGTLIVLFEMRIDIHET